MEARQSVKIARRTFCLAADCALLLFSGSIPNPLLRRRCLIPESSVVTWGAEPSAICLAVRRRPCVIPQDDAAWAIREAMKVCDEAEDMVAAGAVGEVLRKRCSTPRSCWILPTRRWPT